MECRRLMWCKPCRPRWTICRCSNCVTHLAAHDVLGPLAPCTHVRPEDGGISDNPSAFLLISLMHILTGQQHAVQQSVARLTVARQHTYTSNPTAGCTRAGLE